MQNNTPEERLTYQLCIETINKIAKEYGDLNVPGILDPLIAQRIDLAIQDVLAKLEDLDGKTDIKLEDINKIKEDCQNIIATGNELSVNFDEAFTLLESIVAHVNDIESSTELKAQQIQTIKEAIEVLEQNINSLVDRAELIESNIDNLYRNFVKDYNHSVQIYDSVREWKEQIEKNILLSKATLEELKILFPQAQEINRKLEEAIAIGLDLEQEIRNAEQTIITTGQEQVNNMNVVKNDFDTLAEEKKAELNAIKTPYPLKSQYHQRPNFTTNLFDETETPKALFGGDWQLMKKELNTNIQESNTDGQGGWWIRHANGFMDYYRVEWSTMNILQEFFIDVNQITPVISMSKKIGSKYILQEAFEIGNDTNVVLDKSENLYTSYNAEFPTGSELSLHISGQWANFQTQQAGDGEDKYYIKIWQKIG